MSDEQPKKNPFLCPHCGKLAVKNFNTNAEVKRWAHKTDVLTLDCENCGARVSRNTEYGKSNSWELATDTLPTYDVWIFSSLSQYTPRGGVVSITSGLPLERARAMRDQENARDQYSAQIYVLDTRKRVI
ncbi:hypothetical protein [Streptomyces demainii]|uniref:RNA-binding Zn-ribbon protein involved in translation (DUF1610 family) n=1 Tax=Streptomyces demainii TaxID=588122 RepID=A0ABT9KT32_9ACTN|nr:hypothetical protein [Streptomyces demainii]MDP9611560.1 putative RNA-binding Zn-ribbon protein involved in translation (DUF1610 family) [Streptomyces demainii]